MVPFSEGEDKKGNQINKEAHYPLYKQKLPYKGQPGIKKLNHLQMQGNGN